MALVAALAVALWLAPGAAADQLLETLNVDPANTAVTTGTVQLKQGTEYQLQVSGTFTLANGFGQTEEEDALYCFGDTGFATPQCSPTPQRFGDFYIGSSPGKLKNIDAYQEPGGGGPQIGYGITHRYNVNFYPPATGPLTAAGTLAESHCKSGPNPCTTTISGGPITIQIYGPSAPPPPPPPPPPKTGITFVPPVANWGLSTGNVSLAAGLTAVVPGPNLAKGQMDATENVSGSGVGNTSAEEALAERGQIARCIGFAVALAGFGNTRKETILPPPGTNRQIKEVETESGNDVATNFFLGLIMCLADAQQKHSGKSVDTAAASTCPTSIEKLKYTELDVKRIRYVRAGRGTVRGLTTTCTRTSSGLTIHLHSRGTDLRSLFGARLLLGLYKRSGTATVRVAFSKGATPPPPTPTFTGTWSTSWFGATRLTQTGNQVTGTYANCNGTATITGTVTGSALDGTWTEPCDSGQGRIHIVLSADGKSFSGVWGLGTNTPSVAWSGTRTS